MNAGRDLERGRKSSKSTKLWKGAKNAKSLNFGWRATLAGTLGNPYILTIHFPGWPPLLVVLTKIKNLSRIQLPVAADILTEDYLLY